MSNKIRFKSIVAVYLIVEQGNKTLLLLRKNTGYADGLFGLVSGHVEENESINEACVREGHEEAGIVLNSENLDLAYVLQRKEKALTILDFSLELRNMKELLPTPSHTNVKNWSSLMLRNYLKILFHTLSIL
ncbi:NUDIX domain-containing protein [Wolbachia endosymbiont (group B) of Carcina quercana]|uniref:NUDIX domain-containing protein n=1 Tax=Wolbachia endosymbiont (group B) of Carcina quercana TaxID=2953992 RepID=UPI002220BD5E|nr:NUDIX domain-containing protein [Wolbachia endosymbiont (group B) of Carcina quercana]